jgi:hypothetical protein
MEDTVGLMNGAPEDFGGGARDSSWRSSTIWPVVISVVSNLGNNRLLIIERELVTLTMILVGSLLVPIKNLVWTIPFELIDNFGNCTLGTSCE